MPERTERDPKTNAQYAQRGQRLLARSRRKFGETGDTVDAFIRLCADPHWQLRPATTRLYLAAIIYTLEIEVEQNQLDRQRALDGIEQISRLLIERRGRPEPRTSRKKTLYCTEKQRDAVCLELVKRVRKGDQLSAVLRLILQISPIAGVRPSEWPTSQLVGRKLHVKNGKHSGGRAPGPSRPINLEGVRDDLVRIASSLPKILRQLVKKFGSMERLFQILAERLARICKKLKLPRISLYTLRHVAIATWKRAELSAEEIAALAGHVSTRTAWSHYAPGKRGWNPDNVGVSADQETIEYIRSYMESENKPRLWPAWTASDDWGCSAEERALTM